MLPLRFDPVCCQVRVKVPVKAPLYFPDQVPERPVAVVVAGAAGALLAGVVGAAGAELGCVVAVVSAVPELEHAASVTARAAARVIPSPSRRSRLLALPLNLIVVPSAHIVT
jgi:hypothetical protein